MNSRTLSPLTVGFLFAIGSAALFAIRPIFVKLVYAEGVDSTTLIGFRMLFSLPIYLALLIIFLRDAERRKKLNRNNVLATAAVGWLGYYFASFLDLLGLQTVTAQLGRMILYIYPTFVVLLGAIFFKDRITLRVVVSLCITYLGVAVIFGHDLDSFGPEIIVGGLYITGSALVFALYLLFAKNLINEIGSRVFTCIALISASIGILVHYGITHSITSPEINLRATWLVLIIAIFCTVIPTFFTAAAVARIGADKTGIIAMVGPAFTSVFAVWILAEAFTIYHLTGILLTVLGVATLRGKQPPN
ncbi:MAG: EamA family transporter [Pseudomonadota bacterium]